jgi:hypothetical protein
MTKSVLLVLSDVAHADGQILSNKPESQLCTKLFSDERVH